MEVMKFAAYWALFALVTFDVLIEQAAGFKKRRVRLGQVAGGAALGAGTYYVGRKAVKSIGRGLYGDRDCDDWDDQFDDDCRYYNQNRGYGNRGYGGGYRNRRGSVMNKCSNGGMLYNQSYVGDFYCPRWGEPDNYVGCCHDDHGGGYCCPWYKSGSYIGLVIGVIIVILIIIALCCCCFFFFRKKGGVGKVFGGGRNGGGGGGGPPQQFTQVPPPQPQSYPMHQYPQPQPYGYPTGQSSYPTAPYPTGNTAYPTSNPPYPVG